MIMQPSYARGYLKCKECWRLGEYSWVEREEADTFPNGRYKCPRCGNVLRGKLAG